MQEFSTSFVKVKDRMTIYKKSSHCENNELGTVQRFKVTSVEEFIGHLKDLELTKIALDSSEPNDNGFKILFETFYSETRKQIDNLITAESNLNVDEALTYISDYVLRELHATIWSKTRVQTIEDSLYKEKLL